MPQLDLATYSSQIFWLFICVSTIYFSLKFVFIPRIESSIEARKKRIENLLLEAEKMRAESEQLNAKYKDEVKQIHLHALEMHKNAILDFEQKCSKRLEVIDQNHDKKIKNFRDELSAVTKDLESKIEAESEKLVEVFVNKLTKKHKLKNEAKNA